MDSDNVKSREIPAPSTAPVPSVEELNRSFRPVLEEMPRRLFAFAFRRLHDYHRAEDVVQDTLWRAWKSWPDFLSRKRKDYRPWTLAIARNVMAEDHRTRSAAKRKSKLKPVELSEVIDNGSKEPIDQLISDEEIAQFNDAIAKLMPRDQKLLDLSHAGYSYEEIAKLLEMTTTAVGPALTRMRKRLNQLLKESIPDYGKTLEDDRDSH